MSNELEEFLYQKAVRTGTPLGGALEISPLCNLDCKMCYIRHTKEEVDQLGGLKPLSFWMDLIPQLKAAGTLYVNLIGGEPFFYPYIEELYTELFQNGFKVCFTSNGIMLANGIPEWLIKMKPRFIAVSIYGGCNETYERLCGVKHGFDKVCKALENLKEAGIAVKLKSCIAANNKDDIQALCDMAERYHCKLDASAYNYPPVRKEGCEIQTENRMSAKEVAKCEMLLKKNLHKELYPEYCRYLACESFAQNTGTHTTKHWCRAGAATFWVNWKGKLSACGMVEDCSVDLQNHSFAEAWEDIRYNTERIKLSQECAECERREICFACPAMMKVETGSFEGKPQYICDIVDEMIKIAKKY